MIICVVVYIMTFVLVLFVLKRRGKERSQIKSIKVKKNGVEYISNCRHFINISNTKFIIINNQIFLKNDKRKVVIKNISNIEKINDRLYFTGIGKIEILFNNRDWYKYFNVLIFSDRFDLRTLREKAMRDIITNPLCFETKKSFSLFIRIIKCIFKLNFEQKRFIVSANEYFLPFNLVYRLNGKIRKVDFCFK